MAGIRVYMLDEGDTAVRLDWRHLPDLDDLALYVAQERADHEGWWEWGDDEPTRISASPEPEWQWTKISPCWCGEHGWHWDARTLRDASDLDWLADRPPRRFAALHWE